jgi:hypothetical protein
VAELVDALDSGSSGQYACGGSSPPFRIRLLVLLTCLLGTAACGIQGEAELESLAAHLEAATSVLETHASDPVKALEALSAYEEENQVTLAEVERKCRILRKELSARDKRALHLVWIDRTQAVAARLQKLKLSLAASKPAP